MATKNLSDNQRFIFRAVDKKLVTYVKSTDISTSPVTTRIKHTEISPVKTKVLPPSPPPPHTVVSESSSRLKKISLPPSPSSVVREFPSPVKKKPAVPSSPPPAVSKFSSPVQRKPVILLPPSPPPSHAVVSELPSSVEKKPLSPPPSSIAPEIPSTPPERLVSIDTPRADLTSTRRVVVVRTKNSHPATERSGDSETFRQQDSVSIPLVTSTGTRSIHFIRRPILQSEQQETLDATDN